MNRKLVCFGIMTDRERKLKDETDSWTNLQSSEEAKTHGLAGGQHSGERAAKGRSSTALIKSLRCSAQASGTIYVLA